MNNQPFIVPFYYQLLSVLQLSIMITTITKNITITTADLQYK